MEKELWKGNEAVAEAAIRAGCKLFFGYPITPQNEIPEYLAQHLPKIGGCFLQAESEVAAINMVYGAAGCGKRVMTSSSSPGISLKQGQCPYMRLALICWRNNGECTFTDMQKIENRGERTCLKQN